ncbi:hypothetical protein D2908_09495 [Streptococcus sp. LQJ-218]|uniref:hypothetical protein n=1 Tax=Streptococcus sp. LQJ-218 TaxID=2283190 RepID=UPI000E3DC86A|nr:hypothetical protein [Streptococcus sp. LQJ-218]TAA65692.1 hypothetical protein D2908_09495 [Streptococcus sp. LQJ-218]
MVSVALLSTVMLNIALTEGVLVVHANEVVSATKLGNTFNDLSEESILLILKAVDEMPQGMLERGNQEEIDKYMLSKGIDLKFDNEEQVRDFWGYVGAVAWAVGSAAIGIAMLAKIKQFIVAVGTIKAAASTLISIAESGANYENIIKFGYAVVDMESTILEIKAMGDNCFE